MNLGIVCNNPQLLAKVMSLFICPDLHEYALLNFFQKQKRPHVAVMTRETFKKRIQSFLLQLNQNGATAFEISGETADQFVAMMEEMDFVISLNEKESNAYGHATDVLVIPSLCPVGKFRWFKIEQKLQFKTIGRRLTSKEHQVHHQAIHFFMDILLMAFRCSCRIGFASSKLSYCGCFMKEPQKPPSSMQMVVSFPYQILKFYC